MCIIIIIIIIIITLVKDVRYKMEITVPKNVRYEIKNEVCTVKVNYEYKYSLLKGSFHINTGRIK